MSQLNLIKSTSGIRGIIGSGLTPQLATEYGAAFGSFLKSGKIVIGRDSRPSGEIFMPAVIAGLRAVGCDVINLGIVPTPTVEIAIKKLKAAGGICITASHNPSPWNALKFFNHTGEFITPAQYRQFSKIVDKKKYAYQPFDKIGGLINNETMIDEHIKMTLAEKVINRPAIKRRKFKVVIDAINGAGSVALPRLLEKLGVKVIEINCLGNGDFVHEPEPVGKNLAQLGRAVKKHKADLGLACDPDADRLALVDENGNPIGEELTLTIGVMAVLKKKSGPVVINLSTSKVTEEIARWFGANCYYSKVGEANVIETMTQRKGIIGGEGNGGVIYPSFHAGRDALIAAALTLSLLAEEKQTLSGLVETFPKLYNIKTKAVLKDKALFLKKLANFEKEAVKLVGKCKIDRRDGLRFDFQHGWFQLRTSNTEPIYRLIAETDQANLTDSIIKKVKKYFK